MAICKDCGKPLVYSSSLMLWVHPGWSIRGGDEIADWAVCPSRKRNVPVYTEEKKK